MPCYYHAHLLLAATLSNMQGLCHPVNFRILVLHPNAYCQHWSQSKAINNIMNFEMIMFSHQFKLAAFFLLCHVVENIERRLHFPDHSFACGKEP